MRNDEPKGTFVNRHGHKAAVTNTDLDDLSIDNEPVETSGSELKPQKSRPRLSITWTKRRTFIVVAIVLAILLLPVIAGEVIAARYRSGAASVTGKMDTLIQKDVLPAQKQTTIKSATIAGIATKVDDLRSSICDGAMVDNLAALYPRAKSAHDDCVARSGQLAQLSSALRRLEGEARYIEGLGMATKTVTAPISEPFAVITAQQENWQAARDAIRKISPPAEWLTAHKTLGDQAAIIAENWSKLNTAQNAQDKAGFEVAEKSLTSSYEAIRMTVTGFHGELKKTQSSLLSASRNLK